MKYNPTIVRDFFVQQGLPTPVFEWRFHPERKWRFDIAWILPTVPTFLALEVEGGIWIAGGHNRGAQMKKDWEKRNAAAALGWRIIYCEPKDLCTVDMAETVKRCLGMRNVGVIQ